MANIIVLSLRMEMGGTEKALIPFLKYLVEEKHNVDLLLLERMGPLLSQIPTSINVLEVDLSDSDIIEKMAGKYIKNVPFSIPKRFIGKYSKILYKQDGTKNNLFPFLLPRVKKIEKSYDVLFDFHGYGYFLTAYGAEIIKAKKKSVWFHDYNIFWAERVKDYLPEYNRLFCVSKAVKNAVDKRFPEYKNKTEVLLNFIDTEEIKQKSDIPLTDEIFCGDFKILTIGRLEEQKGIDVAIKTAKLIKDRGIKFNWFVIGDGALRENLNNEILKYEVDDVFHLIGQKSNPYPYLKKCDLYVHPSRHEGYAIAIIEARVLGKPMIVSDIEPNREQIENGKTGYVVPLEENEFAEKIEYLYHNKKVREYLSDNLNATVIDFMAGKECLRRYIEET